MKIERTQSHVTCFCLIWSCHDKLYKLLLSLYIIYFKAATILSFIVLHLQKNLKIHRYFDIVRSSPVASIIMFDDDDEFSLWYGWTTKGVKAIGFWFIVYYFLCWNIGISIPLPTFIPVCHFNVIIRWCMAYLLSKKHLPCITYWGTPFATKVTKLSFAID